MSQKRHNSPLSVSAASDGEKGKGRGAPALVFLLLTLPFPAFALLRLSQNLDSRIILGYLLLISLVTFVLYWRDKRQARAAQWRTPEFTLHLAGLLGGWPVALIAQRLFHHKTAKLSFQLAFWAIVSCYQLVSLDFLLNWRFSQMVLSFLHR